MPKSNFEEFKYLYGRLMVLERTIRIRMYRAFALRYKNDCYSKLESYFLTTKYAKKTHFSLRNKALSSQKKLEKVLHSSTLNEMLGIISINGYRNNLKKAGCFELDFNYKDIEEIKSNLIDLRNDVAHFKSEEFTHKKKLYLEALNYFESLFGCGHQKLLPSIPKFVQKPSVFKILKELSTIKPTLLESHDRHLCEAFDYIAIENGYLIERLPRYWTIIRQAYEVKRKMKVSE